MFNHKRGFILAAAVLLIAMPFKPTMAAEGQTLNINAKANILMEADTGQILLEENAHAKLAPASVTKVMTILLIYEALEQERIKWDDIVTVSSHAASMGGSQIYLEPEEQQTVRDLTKSVVIASANDAAVAMAEFIAGSEEGFVLMMNNRAKELGMLNTHFVNACGLDAPGHLTTAYDIALMSRELITKHTDVLQYTKTWMDIITHKTARCESEFGLTNTNRLIRNYTGATGLKTGSTSQAQFCIAATSERDGMKLIAVVMAAPDPTIRFDSAMKMMDYGYANFTVIAKEATGTEVGEIKICKGSVETAPVTVRKQTNVLAPKGKNVVVDSEVRILESLNAPVPKNTKAGEIIYTSEGKEIGRSDLVIADEIKKASAMDMMGRVMNRWLMKG
ncbi:MAG: D-alanyl-D-alanine carboxypeptidase [Clostridiales bacterium]|jgi:D-alanyl-D-alanine carboxypeptidase (penicillin-binding protein 5/6)|nr:D-alanyl-D-alanine carboxypeptidase [Clostridiales bacterium]